MAGLHGTMHKQVYKCPNHTGNLNNMRLNNKWCDLTIKVDGQEFRAHKTVLAANLRYFETMLTGDSFRESNEGVITMDSIKTDMEAFLTYAYTGEISITDDNALSLLEAANYLGEDGIRQACIEFLEKHSKAEASFRANDVAKSIDRLSLKNVEKSRILSNFEDSSQSSEYLDLDFTSLSDLLSDAKVQLAESQQIFFEGIIRWILHKPKKRRIRMNDLLSFVDVSKIPADYFVKYVGSMANCSDGNSAIMVKDLMSWYYTRSQSQPITKQQDVHSEQTLMILGVIDRNFSLQSYNFAERKWSQPQRIILPDGSFACSCAVLNDKLYFIHNKAQIYSLHMFDPWTNSITLLNSSSSILPYAAMCACDRFIYVCGGDVQEYYRSNQVLRYDPRTNSFESLPPMKYRRSSAAAIFYRGCLYVVGGLDDQANFNQVEKYDPDKKEWMELPSMREHHTLHSVTALDGKLYACGGFSTNAIEVYDPAKNSWQLAASTKRPRRNFTLVAYNGKLLAIAGDSEVTVEVYDPSKDLWQVDDEMSEGLRIEDNLGGLFRASDSQFL